MLRRRQWPAVAAVGLQGLRLLLLLLLRVRQQLQVWQLQLLLPLPSPLQQLLQLLLAAQHWARTGSRGSA